MNQMTNRRGALRRVLVGCALILALSRGIWLDTPLGRSGLSIYAASVYQQVEMAAWSFSRGYASHWSCNRG